MKNLLYIFFILSFVEVSLAQNPMSIRMPISTPGGNMTTTNYIYFPNNGVSKPPMHDYKIKLVNDSVVSKYSRIEIDDSIHYFEFKKAKKNYLIRPQDTKEVRFTNSSGVTYIGIPQDTCWLFKIRSGKISTYAYFPEPDKEYIVAIQKGSDPVVAYTKENIQKLVAGNEEASKLAMKGKLYGALCVYNGWIRY